MHGITATDRTFSIRQVPWMGLLDGQVNVFEDYKSREELQPLVHGWEPVVEPVYRKVPYVQPHVHSPATCNVECSREEGTDHNELTCWLNHTCTVQHDMGERFEEVEDYKLGARSDNGDTLAINGKDYEFIDNSVMWDMAEAVEGLAKGSVRFETGGSLLGGKKVWLLIAMSEPLIIKGDNSFTIPYLNFQNSHDGSGSFRAQATLVRQVCQNTSIAADIDSQQRGTEIVFRHTKNVHERITQAQQALAGWRESVENFRAQMELLAMLHVTPAQTEWFIEKMIPMPTSGMITERVANNVTEARGLLFNTLHSITNEGSEDTALGLFNAAVEHHDYNMRAHSAESRFTRNFIKSNKGGVKAHAFKFALDAATV